MKESIYTFDLENPIIALSSTKLFIELGILSLFFSIQMYFIVNYHHADIYVVLVSQKK